MWKSPNPNAASRWGRPVSASWALWVALYFPIALLPPLPLMLVVLLGAGVSVAAPIEALLRRERTPPELRARVFATQMAAPTLAAPIGVVGAGALVEVIDLRPAVLALATLNALGALLLVRPACGSFPRRRPSVDASVRTAPPV